MEGATKTTQKEKPHFIGRVLSTNELWTLIPSWLAMLWLAAKAQWFWRSRPDLSFGWIVLLLCIYLFWEAWEKRPSVAPRPSLWSIPVTVLGIGMLFLMEMYQAALGMSPAVVMGVAVGAMLLIGGNLLFVYGWRGVRHFGFPYAFLLIALPLPSFLHGPIVNGLQNLVTHTATEILNLFGVPAQRAGSLIELPVGTVGVNEACSGIRSLQSTLMATLFISYLYLNRFWFRATLVASGVVLAFIGNLTRTLFLCSAALKKGIEEVNVVHDAAGWSIFAFTVAGVALLAWGFHTMERKLKESPSAHGPA